MNDFYFDDDTDDIQVHVFCASSFIGEPHESEEMKPQWFPHFLAGQFFRGTFRFKDTDTLLEHDINVL